MGEGHPESPARMGAILKRLNSSGLLTNELNSELLQFQATPISKKLLELAHDKSYIDFIYNNAPSSGFFELDPDTRMNTDSLSAALLSAGAAINAVDLIFEGKITSAFCATRPPGHHAERNKAMGFCFFNNVAIAAIYARQKYNLERVAILDFDVHHGNGTQEILQDKQGFLFCSTFEHPLYPNSGTESHPKHIINSPLSANTGSKEFRATIERDWLPALHQYKPQMIFVSAGFDAHIEDQISRIELDESDYRWISQQIKDIAEHYSSGRIVSTLEGGYSIDALGRSVVTFIKGLTKSL